MPRPTVRIATRLFTPEVAAAAFRQRVLADAFATLGCAVQVVTTTPPAGGPVDDGKLQVSRWPVLRDENGNIRGYLQYLSFDGPALFRLLAGRRPSLLVAEPPPTTGLVVRIASAFQRVPYAYYAADVWSDGAASTGAPRLLVSLLRRLESWVMRGAVLTLAVSDGVAERVALLGVPQARILLVGNGVDTTLFRPDGERPDQPGPYFAYTGTMSEWQGADVFVRALAEVRRTRPGVRMVFLGQGSERRALERLADELVPGAVDFPGVVPPGEAARWLRGATAGLVSIKPGLGYDFAKPTKIYAATACGTPVVFAGVGAGRDLVAQERLGWAPGYSDDAVASAMTAALEARDASTVDVDHLASWTRENASLSAKALQAARAALAQAGVAVA